MRRDQEFFDDAEIELIYIAKRLSEAKKVEALLTSAGVDYAVGAEEYLGGVLFRRVRVGAFFYVLVDAAGPARDALKSGGYRAHRVEAEPDGRTAS